ncbi:hypothetical protein RND71_043724 [Anisodus tanguticus]|uniref:Major facilitator superfamily (MFS) profile domain-containing protein n=1 Tax=Anisodus tanguticus TaxID=243964 RepID=A0AAE1UTX6_9SOLA|nr:hypothetical protein RND71_043724 [Anisodus tanguticus]
MINYFTVKLCSLTAMTGFLFGYDTGIISGSMIFIKDEMELSTFWIELIVSCTVGFAWLSAWSSAFISDKIGRKSMIILTSILFMIASLVMGLAPDKNILLLGRAIAGCAVGLGSIYAPIYIAELAPKKHRGSLVTFNSAFITFGLFASTLLASFFSYLPSHIGWRLGFASLPSFLQMVGFYFMPESPRWLCILGKYDEALEIMIKIYGDIDIAKENVKVETTITKQLNESYFVKLKKVFNNKETRYALIIGCSLHMAQQWCGINTIMYYGAIIIQMSGVLSKRISIWFTVVVAVTNALTSLIGLFIIDKVTRRKLTLISMVGIVICLALMGIIFTKIQKTEYCPNENGYLVLIVLCLFLFCFEFGIGPMAWGINSEIYPMWARSVSVSFAASFNWLNNMIVSFTFLTISEYISMQNTFYLYMLISTFFTFIFYFYLPETKHKSMEDSLIFRH